MIFVGEITYNIAVCRIVNHDLSYTAPESVNRRRGSTTEEIEEEICPPTECSICLMDINKNDKCRLLPQCSHLFHTVCVDAWFKLNVHCPLCKRSLRDILNGGDGSGTSRTSRPAAPSSAPAPNPAPLFDPERGTRLRSESGHGQQTQNHGAQGMELFYSFHRSNSSSSSPSPNPSAPGNPHPNPRAVPTVLSGTQSDSHTPHTQNSSSNDSRSVTIFQSSTAEGQDQGERVPYLPPRRSGSHSYVSSNGSNIESTVI